MELEARLRRAETRAWVFRALFIAALLFLFVRRDRPLVAADGTRRAELTADGLALSDGEGRVLVRLTADGLDLVGGGGTVKLGVRADGPHLNFLDRDNGQLDLAAAFLRFVCDGEVKLNSRAGPPVGLAVRTVDGREERFPP